MVSTCIFRDTVLLIYRDIEAIFTHLANYGFTLWSVTYKTAGFFFKHEADRKSEMYSLWQWFIQ